MIFRVIGSKGKIGATLRKLFPSRFRTYQEPFCGTAQMLRYVPRGVFRWVNDLNPDVVRVLKAVQNPANPDFFDRLLERKESFLPEAEKMDYIKAVFLQSKTDLVLDDDPLAWLTLNAYSYGQMVSRTRKHIASFPKDFRNCLGRGGYGFSRLTREYLEGCRTIMQGVRITCGDYRDLMNAEGADIFSFCDIPYWIGDQNGGIYEKGFSFDDHHLFCAILKQAKHKVMLTVNDCPHTLSLYLATDFQCPFRARPGFRMVPYYVVHSGIRRKRQTVGAEWAIMNYDE